VKIGRVTVRRLKIICTPLIRGRAALSTADRGLTAVRRGEVADPTNLERRRGPGRRLSDFVRDAEEGEMNKEQFMFLMAIDAFKRVNDKTFPAWTDVLEIIRKLGYRKTMPSELNLGGRAEDWRERADGAGQDDPRRRSR
jgi:DNA polymerase III alpha subunit